MPTIRNPHLHIQDKSKFCGPACAMMVVAAASRPLTDADKQELWFGARKANFLCPVPDNKLNATCPGVLANMIRANGSGVAAGHAGGQANSVGATSNGQTNLSAAASNAVALAWPCLDEATDFICAEIVRAHQFPEQHFPPIALVKKGGHWIVVVGFRYARSPSGDESGPKEVAGFEILDPTGVSGFKQNDVETHSVTDDCGTGQASKDEFDWGTRHRIVTARAWRSLWLEAWSRPGIAGAEDHFWVIASVEGAAAAISAAANVTPNDGVCPQTCNWEPRPALTNEWRLPPEVSQSDAANKEEMCSDVTQELLAFPFDGTAPVAALDPTAPDALWWKHRTLPCDSSTIKRVKGHINQKERYAMATYATSPDVTPMALAMDVDTAQLRELWAVESGSVGLMRELTESDIVSRTSYPWDRTLSDVDRGKSEHDVAADVEYVPESDVPESAAAMAQEQPLPTIQVIPPASAGEIIYFWAPTVESPSPLNPFVLMEIDQSETPIEAGDPTVVFVRGDGVAFTELTPLSETVPEPRTLRYPPLDDQPSPIVPPNEWEQLFEPAPERGAAE